MAEIRVDPRRKIYEAAREAAARGHWLEIRGGKVMEIVPRKSRGPHRPDPDGPKAA